MSTASEIQQSPWRAPGVSRYVLIGLVALGAVFLVMIQRGFGNWALLPVLAGLIGGFTRFGPILFLAAVGVSFHTVASTPALGRRGAFDARDLIISGAVLAYVLAHYRVQGMILRIFPAQAGRKRDSKRARKAKPKAERRSPSVLGSSEIALTLLSLPLFASAAQILDTVSRFTQSNPGLRPPIWHGIVLSWEIGVAWLVAAGFMEWRRRRGMSLAEATLELQDMVWAETRREQRRINRWAVWGRLRARRRENKS